MLVWTLRAVSADIAKLSCAELQPRSWRLVSPEFISTGWQVGKEIPALGWQSIRKPWRAPWEQALPSLVFPVPLHTSRICSLVHDRGFLSFL